MKKKEAFFKEREKLLHWFLENQRPLPWRKIPDPYPIWISEVMLQQTTVTTVIPYFKKFMEQFPDVLSLAKSSESQVKAIWAGLGYYNRAKQLWRASQILVKEYKGEFPKNYTTLMELPGFGPYTSRAVSSIAFDEPVGVLDGNVIRVLSRYFDWPMKWWQGPDRLELQFCVDNWVQNFSSAQMNQALMELGATICTPQSPSCLTCPLIEHCQSYKKQTVSKRPLSKPKKPKQLWLWQAHVHKSQLYVALTKTHDLPFLKGQDVLPGKAQLLSKKPSIFDFKHSITHYQIYVTVQSTSHSRRFRDKNIYWVQLNQLKLYCPSSLIHKAVAFIKDRPR